MMQKEVRRERAYFCSQFVATLLKVGGLKIYQNPALMTPHCLAQLPYLEKVFAGNWQIIYKQFVSQLCYMVNE